MSWLNGLRERARMLLRRGAVDRELADEMAFHLERETEANLARGLSPAEARRAARMSFGGEQRHREFTRDEWGATVLAGVGNDARRGLRRLAQQRGFTAAALLTLGLGIGANTAIFSLVRSVLLRPLPYEEPAGLVMVWNIAADQSEETWLSLRELLEYRERVGSVQALAAYSETEANLTGGVRPERVRAAFITPGLTAVLGVQPAQGRPLADDDAADGGAAAVLLSHELWQRRFGGGPVLGTPVRVGGVTRTVVGIMPPGFRLPLDYREEQPTELWLPAAVDRTGELSFGNRSWYLVGRLVPGAGVERANAELRAAHDAWEDAGWIDEGGADGRAFVPVDRLLTRSARPALLLLFGVVALVLLIACANVAHLLLARADARRREVATQVALGASRGRVVRQLLVESGLLAAGGALLGIVVGWVVLRAAVALSPLALVRNRAIELDPAVLAYTALLALTTTVIAGLAPALQLSGMQPAAALRGGRGDTAGLGRGLRRSLVVVETALAVTVVVAASLLGRSFAELRAVELGYRTDHLLTARVALPAADYAEAARVSGFYDQLLARVRDLPGVEQAAAARILPLSNTIGDWSITLEHRPRAPGENPNGDWQVVTPGWFETLGIQLREGRTLTHADGADAPLVALINETMADRYWPGMEALGQRFHLGTLDQPWVEVVGITRDIRHNAVVEDARAEMFLPHAQFTRITTNPGGLPPLGMTIALRTTGDPLALLPAVRGQVQALDPSLPLSAVRTMDEVARSALAQPRFTAQLLGAFGVLSLLLATVGLYGVISYMAARRTRELGIRLALGAERRAVAGMVVREGLGLAAAGLVLGLLASVWTTRFLAGQLYGVGALDPVTFAGVGAVLLAVSALASWLPARRAAGVSPLTALRLE